MNTPIISVSSTRKAIIYSFTRVEIATQLARMQSGMRNVVSRTKGSEMPSTPIWKVIGPSQGLSSTNWN